MSARLMNSMIAPSSLQLVHGRSTSVMVEVCNTMVVTLFENCEANKGGHEMPS